MERVETVFDNGVYRDETFYADGTARFWREWDVNNVHDWTQIVRGWDADGDLSNYQINYDDGLAYFETYSGGVLQFKIEHDGPDGTDGQFDWDVRTTFYDASGEISSFTVQYDNGVSEETYYDDGDVKSIYLIIDSDYDTSSPGENDGSGGVHPWLIQVRFYDFDNNLIRYEIRYDNGRVDAGAYSAEGSVTVINDPENAYSWDQITSEYDANGDLTREYTIYDDGTTLEKNWADGVRVEFLQEDLQDVKSWESILREYDENGVLQRRVTEYDDGGEKLETWENGIRVDIVQEDHGNTASWDLITILYDDDGNKQSRVVEYDSGVVKTELWDTDGDQISITEEDFSADGSAESWIDVAVMYDDDGNFVSRVINYDNGDIYSKTVEHTELFDLENIDAEFITYQLNLGPSKSWAEIVLVEYEGPYYLKDIILDNGNSKVDAYLPDFEVLGTTKIVGELDNADLYSWIEKTTTVSETLGRKDFFLWHDNSDQELTFFDTETEDLEFYGQRDISDQEDWQGQQSFYDGGELERIVTQYDEGDFEIEYFASGVSTGVEELTAAEYEAAHGDFDAIWTPYKPVIFDPFDAA